MIFGSAKKIKCEVAAEIVAALSHNIIESNDSVGYGLFSDKIKNFVYPFLGMNQFFNILDGISTYQHYGGGYDLNKAVKYLLSFLRKQTLVIIVSDFIGLKKGWETSLRLAAKKFDLIGLMIRDPRDQILPADITQVVLQDPYSDTKIILDPKTIKKEFESYAKHDIEFIKETFEKTKADFTIISTDSEYMKEVVKFFKLREKRIR